LAALEGVNLVARKRLLPRAAVALGSVVAVALGIVLTAPPAHAAGVVYGNQIGGPTTGKQPPIA
jgi:hypothetical protein